ncbi:MAG: hemolysin III family protein [Thermoanaerobaculia bacterium]|nr:hemolysin III family protein [Thermoanaerobaculia bacterium]
MRLSLRPPERPALFRTELANSVTHGVGLGMSIAGLGFLLYLAERQGSTLHVVACAVYGSTLVLLYLASTLFHGVHGSWPRLKRVLLIVDHSAIYLLIAGTYTPFALLSLQGAAGWRLFALIWALALAGVAGKVVLGDRYPIASVVIYVVMGWLFLPVVGSLAEKIGPAGVGWLIAGSLVYCTGIVFYYWRRVPHHHAIWHLFVMAGSAIHFFAVVLFTLSGPVTP